MKKHLPKGRWDRQTLAALPWKELAAIARYPYRRSKAAAKRRIHKLERRAAHRELYDRTCVHDPNATTVVPTPSRSHR